MHHLPIQAFPGVSMSRLLCEAVHYGDYCGGKALEGGGGGGVTTLCDPSQLKLHTSASSLKLKDGYT